MLDLSPKQERFCQKYIECGNASEAYRWAYDVERMKGTTINRNAKALLDNSKITTRIGEIKQPVLEATRITLLEVIDGLRRAIEIAEATNTASAMTAAYRELARLGDLYPVERREVATHVAVGFAERLAARWETPGND